MAAAKLCNKPISSVTPLPGKMLRLELANGCVLDLDMSGRLHTVRFYPLRDESVFETAGTNGYYVRFAARPDSELDFSLSEAVLMAVNRPKNACDNFNPFADHFR